MTPKEKAQELTLKFFDFDTDRLIFISKGVAKRMAIIAVDEIIKNGFNPQLPYNYWEEVKEEIAKI
jgi:hypothetical protein